MRLLSTRRKIGGHRYLVIDERGIPASVRLDREKAVQLLRPGWPDLRPLGVASHLERLIVLEHEPMAFDALAEMPRLVSVDLFVAKPSASLPRLVAEDLREVGVRWWPQFASLTSSPGLDVLLIEHASDLCLQTIDWDVPPKTLDIRTASRLEQVWPFWLVEALSLAGLRLPEGGLGGDAFAARSLELDTVKGLQEMPHAPNLSRLVLSDTLVARPDSFDRLLGSPLMEVILTGRTNVPLDVLRRLCGRGVTLKGRLPADL